jgi:hypothetical protein
VLVLLLDLTLVFVLVFAGVANLLLVLLVNAGATVCF